MLNKTPLRCVAINLQLPNSTPRLDSRIFITADDNSSCLEPTLTLTLSGPLPLLTHRLHRLWAQLPGLCSVWQRLIAETAFQDSVEISPLPLLHALRDCVSPDFLPKLQSMKKEGRKRKAWEQSRCGSNTRLTCKDHSSWNERWIQWSANRIEYLKSELALQTRTQGFLSTHNYSKMSI